MNYSHLKVIDFHTHFPVVNTIGRPAGKIRELHPILRDYAQDRAAKMRQEWSAEPNLPLAETPAEIDAALDQWVGEAERHGLRHVNFVTGQNNDLLASLVARHPDRFCGFAHHELLPGAHIELRRAVDELGLKGYKLFGPHTEQPFEDPRLRPVWEFCAERELPVLIHFGFLGRGGGIVEHPRMSPLSLFEVARDFPEIPFVIPHFGAGYWRELLALCWSLPNIYIDTSGSNQWMRWMPYDLTLESLFRKAFDTVGPERIIFGTDSIMFPRGFAERYLQDQLRAAYTQGFSDADVQLIFGGNAARLLKLEDQ